MDPGETMALIAVVTGITLSVKAIVSGILRYQENQLRYSAQRSDSVSDARLERIEHAVDAIAIEIERVSEAQRFTTKLLSERDRVLPGG